MSRLKIPHNLIIVQHQQSLITQEHSRHEVSKIFNIYFRLHKQLSV